MGDTTSHFFLSIPLHDHRKRVAHASALVGLTVTVTVLRSVKWSVTEDFSVPTCSSAMTACLFGAADGERDTVISRAVSCCTSGGDV